MPTPLTPSAPDTRAARRCFSALGWALLTILAAAALLQLLLSVVASFIWPQGDSPVWVLWFATFAPIYLAAVPLGLLVLRRVPAAAPAPHAPRPRPCVAAVPVTFFMMYAGNLAGTLVLTLLQSLFGLAAVNPIEIYVADETVGLRALCLAILAPLIEEFIFRKQLLDRMRPYGEKLAILVSALAFALFHGNLSQFFYAFTLGLVFGYIYLRTGQLRWSAALHILVNTLGSVVGPALANSIDPQALEAAVSGGDTAALAKVLPQLTPLLLYSLALIALSVAGLVVLCVNVRRLHFDPAPQELPKGTRLRTVCLNWGMGLYIACSLALVALTFIA